MGVNAVSRDPKKERYRKNSTQGKRKLTPLKMV
jgi:hypothetical protein